MKKHTTRLWLFLSLVLILSSLCACGKTENVPTTEATIETETSTIQETTEVTTEVESVLSDIVLHTENLKTEYYRNEELDLSGLKVELLYSNDVRETISLDKCLINDIDMSTCTAKELIVTYGEFSKAVNLDVTYSVTDIEPCTKYTTISLNLRSGPGTEFDSITVASANTEVTVTGEADNGWARILYNNKEYFCSNKYLTEDAVNIVAEEVSGKMINDVDGEFIYFKTADPYWFRVTGYKGTEEALKRAHYYWGLVPSNIKDLLENVGWDIYIVDYDFGKKYGYDYKIAGLTIYSLNEILINNKVSDVDRAFLHEVGHALDYTYEYLSKSDEFNKLYEKEKSNFKDCTSIGDGLETSNSSEFFAAVFTNAILNPENCKKQVPETYAFVTSYMNK